MAPAFRPHGGPPGQVPGDRLRPTIYVFGCQRKDVDADLRRHDGVAPPKQMAERLVQPCGPANTIQLRPNLSATMPNFDAKNVLASGMVIWPPSASAANTRSASVSSDTVSDSQTPLNAVFPVQRPSD